MLNPSEGVTLPVIAGNLHFGILFKANDLL